MAGGSVEAVDGLAGGAAEIGPCLVYASGQVVPGGFTGAAEFGDLRLEVGEALLGVGKLFVGDNFAVGSEALGPGPREGEAG